MTITQEIVEALVKHVRDNYPYTITTRNDRVSAWYTNDAGRTPVAEFRVGDDKIYLNYGARYYDEWPSSIVLDLKDPGCLDQLSARLSSITL